MRSPASMGALPPTLLALLATLTTAQQFYGGLLVSTTKKVVPDCTRHSKVGDTLSMHYRGTLQSDGSEFDSSHSRGPFTFKLGAGQVIEGWDKGLVGMCIGEMRNLTIPPGMAYGDRAIGKIPAGSTLVFETELLGIEGVKPESEPIQEPNVPPENKKGPGEHKGGEPGSGHGHKDGPQHDDDGECKLLGPFALLIQGALGLLAIMSLVFKRWREVPRRPLKVWSFDVSKQVFGSVLLHLANLLMSMFSSGDFDITKATTPDATAASTAAGGGFVQNAQQDRPNPCSFYLLNLAIDTTIGIPILVLLLRLLHYAFSLTPFAKPAGSLRSGNYGHPPKASWWLKQSFIYFLGLLGMKLCVFIIFQLLPWLGWVGDWALRWTEGKAWVQVLFVMLIFPLVMNAMQYYIIDSFIKDPAGASDGPQEEDEREEGGENEGLIAGSGRRHSEDADGEEEHGVLREAEAGRLKEANPTPMPVEYDSDDEQTRVGSSGSTAKGIAK